MKALLIQPFISIPGSWIPYFPQEPLGLEYIAAAAAERGHSVGILDCIGQFWSQYTRLGDGRFHIGATPEQTTHMIASWEPEVVGITLPFSNQVKPAVAIARLTKQVNPKITTVIGGSAACAQPEKLLQENPELDVVVTGEGEVTFAELLEARPYHSIKGVAYRNGCAVLRSEPRAPIQNLDDIPFPSRLPLGPYSMSLFRGPVAARVRLFSSWLLYNRDWKAIRTTLAQPRAFAPRNHAVVLTARGCPFNCYYCAVHNVWRGYRRRSIDNLMWEIEQLYRDGVRTISFVDDNLPVPRLREVCQGIIRLGLRVQLRAASGLFLYDGFDRETFALMKRAGFTDVYFGIESGNQEVLYRIIGKKIHLPKVREVARLCREAGLTSGGYFMIGVPGETMETMQETIEFALSSGLDRLRLYTCQPLPGSRLFEDCVRNGWLAEDYTPDRALLFSSRSFIRTGEFSPEDVTRLAEAGKALFRRAGRLDQRG